MFATTNLGLDFIAQCPACGCTWGNCVHSVVVGRARDVLDRPYGETTVERAIRRLDEKIERLRLWTRQALVFWRRIARNRKLAPDRKLTRLCTSGHARTCALDSAWRARGPPG